MAGRNLRVAIAQINATVGDVARNSRKIIEYISAARGKKADIVILPELALCGYPPEDLLLKRAFLKRSREYLKKVTTASKSILVIAGFPDRQKDSVFNAAAIIYDKRLIGVYRKIALPNYGVFDEKRYFQPGRAIAVADFGGGLEIGINICEDIWYPQITGKASGRAPGVKVIINISASPYHAGKIRERQNLLRATAKKDGVFICYCNLVGGQDELVFDGGSLVYTPGGEVLARAKQFEEDLLIADLDIEKMNGSGRIERLLAPEAEIYSALTIALRDYVQKNGFKKAVLGVSGGIDSALTSAICRDALGKENVTALSMPSSFTSARTKKDTGALIKNLGIRLITIPINNVHGAYLSTLKKRLRGKGLGIAGENLQARIRGNMLMAFSNRFGWLVVTTGNKSEVSVGYCTLYGDTAGGFGILKDVPKTLVYRIARYVNKKNGCEVIPVSIIKRPPTAELRRGQKDSDSLPPYPILDKILDDYIEKDKPRESITGKGFGKKTVERVAHMVDRNEYKRRQSPPGAKITPKAFGRDRRMPIVNKFM